MNSFSRIGFLAAVLSGIAWGTYGTFSTLLRDMGLDGSLISMISPLFQTALFLILVTKANFRLLFIPRALLPLLLFYGLIGAAFYYSLVKAYTYLPLAIVSTLVFCNLFLLMFFEVFGATGGMVLLPTLGLGLITSMGSYYLYVYALKRMEPTYVQLGYVMDPATASILGLLAFGQSLSSHQLVGLSLILIVVSWVQWSERGNMRKRTEEELPQATGLDISV